MRYLNELNLEELKEVYEKNTKLQEMVSNDMMDNAAFWCSEYLDCWERGAADYSIGWDRGTYFDAKDWGMFLHGLEKAQKTFCFLAGKYEPLIEKAWQLYDKYTYHAYDFSDLNYERIENRLTEIIEDLENAVYRQLMGEYEYIFDSNNQRDYFINDFAERYLEDTEYYVDDNMIMYRDIYYKECLA